MAWDALQNSIAADIATYGWSVIKIEADDRGPGFAYTIGLHQRFEHPEVIIVGLRSATAHAILNDVGEDIRGGARYRVGEVCSTVLEGYDVTFRVVPVFQYPAYLGTASRFYGDESFSVVQLVYPDRDRRWPWQEGVSDEFRAAQPILADSPFPDWAR